MRFKRLNSVTGNRHIFTITSMWAEPLLWTSSSNKFSESKCLTEINVRRWPWGWGRVGVPTWRWSLSLAPDWRLIKKPFLQPQLQTHQMWPERCKTLHRNTHCALKTATWRVPECPPTPQRKFLLRAEASVLLRTSEHEKRQDTNTQQGNEFSYTLFQ